MHRGQCVYTSRNYSVIRYYEASRYYTGSAETCARRMWHQCWKWECPIYKALYLAHVTSTTWPCESQHVM